MTFDNQELIHIAYTVKPHGLNGHISIKLIPGYSQENLKKDKPVFLIIGGMPVPFFVEDKKRSGNYYATKFKHINNSESALKYKNCKVLSFTGEIAQNESNVNEFELMGYAVYDNKHGFIGNVIGFNDIPGNPVFETQLDNKTIILPFIEDIIENINHKTKAIQIQAPEGLIDIYLD